MAHKITFSWLQAIRSGLVGGAIALLISLIGMVAAFGERDIIFGVLTMGQLLFLAPMFIFGYVTAKRAFTQPRNKILLFGLLSGIVGASLLAAFVLLGQMVNIRAVLINASPALFRLLTFNQDLPMGFGALLLSGALAGGFGAAIYLLPDRLRNGVTQALIWVVLLGLLRELLVIMIGQWGWVANLFRWLFAPRGLTVAGALAVFVIITSLVYLRTGMQKSAGRFSRQVKLAPKVTRGISFAVLVVLLLLLPRVVGRYPSEVLDNVGIFIIMGLGLNIVVGFAGILDLGYVAFFAIGAYAMGVLTSPELGFFNLTYWQALPIALVVSALSGTLLGLPVLKMRGDYLAIVTLGFGEIIRLLVLSDWLRPFLGGSTGIQRISRPNIGPIAMANPEQLFYLILAACILTGFIAVRLKDSRLGRAWIALREDEDVAQAMGVNKVQIKLLAFTVGATLAGMSGTIFAAKLTSVYPHSFNLLISINTLALIIVGGMGSIPGVIVGALALYGLPELLREFNEFRLLVYGAVLVGMMLLRPEGLWPEARRRLELHEEEEEVVESVKKDLEGEGREVPSLVLPTIENPNPGNPHSTPDVRDTVE